MSEEVLVALFGAFYALQLFIGKGINLRNIIKNGNTLKSDFAKEIAIPNAKIVELDSELVKLRAVNTIVIKELIENYQARLEITNDKEEEIKLLAKIKFLSDLLT